MPGPGDTQIADFLAAKVPGFDIDAARKSGAADSDIVNFLAPKVPGFDVAGARAHYATVPGAAGADATKTLYPSDPNEIAQPHMGTPGIAFADHAINALSLGQGPRIAAAVQSMLGNGNYSDLKAKYDASLHEDKRDHGLASDIGSVYGLLGNPLNEAVAAKPILGGAALGAVQGSGAAKDDLQSQLFGATAGALGGAAAGGLVKGAQVLGGPSAGQRVVTDALAKSPDASATLAKLVASGRGDQAVLADLSPRLNGVLDRAANRNPDVMDATQAIVAGRQPDAAGRMMNDMTDAVGNPHLSSMLDQAKQQRLAFADGPYGFQGLREANGSLPVSSNLQADVLSRPGMSDALEKVKLSDKLNGTNVGAQIQKSMGAGGLGLTAMAPGANTSVSYGALSQLERSLDGMAGKAFASGDVALGNSYKTLRNGVGDFLGQAVPEHAQVKATYAAMKSNEEAMQAGADAFKNPSVRDVQAEFNSLTPARKDLYRKGMASQAIDGLQNRAGNLDASAPYMNASSSMQQKLEMLFGDQPTFQKFMQGAEAERTLAKLRGVTGGSATARRGADEAADGVGMAMRGATSLAHGRGVMSTALHTLAPNLVNGMRNQTAADAGGLLNTQGADAITQLMQRLQTPNQTMNLLTQGGLGLAGGAGGGVAGLFQQPNQ